ncbi:10153_t:CDS:1, partial [Entrophospora sp. SA101]
MDQQTFDNQDLYQENFDNQDLYQENFNNMNFDSSQVFGDAQSETTDANVSTTSSTLTSSLVWEHFDKNPSYALGYNVCKKCTI